VIRTLGRRGGRLLPLFALLAALILLLSSIAIAAVNERLYLGQRLRQVDVLAQTVAAGLAAPLAFDDRAGAQEYLSALRANPDAIAAAVYDTGGRIAFSYTRRQTALPPAPPILGTRIDGDRVSAAVPVLQNGTRLGTVYLENLTERTASRLSRYGGTAVVALTASLLLALLGAAQAALARSSAGLARKSAELEEANRNLQVQMVERERAEGALRHSQKMDAIGQLTGGVAHDVNNHLQVIGANLQLLRGSPRLDATDRARLDGAAAGVSRAATLTAQLLAFARRQPLEPRVVNLGRIVRDMGDLLRRSLGDGIEVETVVAGGLWNVEVDRHQVENAVLNLAVNARDAMNGRGRLTLEVGNAALDERYAAEQADVAPGQYIMLAISDTGCGMPADLLDRAFEPFFTTKPLGHGTGLGLSMVHGFIKQSGGHVKIYSEVGQGTTVKLYLPRVVKEEDAEAVEPASVRGGTETVLVVEDDAAVRSAVAEMIRSLGYQTATAAGPDAALAILESGIDIDLLFTDVVMPGPTSTPEFVRRAQVLRPHLAVLYTSGYTANAIVHQGRLDEGVVLLSKPYTREALAAKLRQMLDGRSRPLPPGAVTSNGSAGAQRVLLVEDEPLVRLATADMLEELGWIVSQAKDGKEGLALLEQGGHDLLVTDLNMPGVDGRTLAERALRMSSGLAVVISSGEAAAPPPGTAALQKPFTTAALQGAIAQAIDARRAAQAAG
jgi:signal transduction histidine kinase/DNA-binding response OmpR family regulator